MNHLSMHLLLGGMSLAAVLPLQVAVSATTLTEDKSHVRRWNQFTEQLYALHKQQLAGHEVAIETATGGYAGRPAFYREKRYLDAASGRLLSIIQWEKAHPDKIHSIEVYRHDDRGRVVREYASTYLPDFRNAPTQTLVFLHRYADGLHAWRSFDASNELLNERCEGVLDGRAVSLSLDIDEIDQAQARYGRDGGGILATSVYQRCFADMPDTAADALPPR